MMMVSLLPLIAMLSPAPSTLDADAGRTLALAAQMEQDPSLSAICEMKAGDVPIELVSQALVIRFSVYARMELVGPKSCREVAFYIPENDALGRRFYRLLAAREKKKEYAFLLEVHVDGVATYDPKEGRVRIDIDDMADLPDA